MSYGTISIKSDLKSTESINSKYLNDKKDSITLETTKTLTEIFDSFNDPFAFAKYEKMDPKLRDKYFN